MVLIYPPTPPFSIFFSGPEFQMIRTSGTGVRNDLEILIEKSLKKTHTFEQILHSRNRTCLLHQDCFDSANWRRCSQSGLALIVICFLEPMSPKRKDGY